MSRILVVDDEESLRFTFSDFLSGEGYEVSTAKDYEEAVRMLSEGDFDVIFADILLGRRTGIDLLKHVRERYENIPVVMITGAPDLKTATEAVRLGAFDYIAKPVRQETLLRVSRLALNHRRLVREKEAYRTNLEAIFMGVRDGILSVDRNFALLEMNGAMERLCGRSKREIASGGESALFAAFGPRCMNAVKEAMEKGDFVSLEDLVLGKEGKTKSTVIPSVAPLRDETGRISAAILVFHDVTRVAELEKKLGERGRMGRLIGESGTMQEVYDLIEVLADVDSTVLISGESGTGKELAAESIHISGRRQDGPLVKVNCAALPETLLESELFGHVKGAFTGAIADKAGRFERADGGTLFLDEIGEITPRMQLRLLRVLQEMEFERVGDSRPVRVDVRVLAATNCDLLKRVREGAFREDLYYRLKVVELKLPSLRERREDIPLLSAHYIDYFNNRFSRRIGGISGSAMEALLAYRWPGNVREFKHALEHAFVHCRGDLISKEHLPRDIFAEPPLAADAGNELADRRRIMDALERAAGSRTKAARLLGISRRTLYRWMDQFNIDFP